MKDKTVSRMLDDLERQIDENNIEISKMLSDNKIRAENNQKEYEKAKKEFEDSLKNNRFHHFFLPSLLIFTLLGLFIFSVLR